MSNYRTDNEMSFTRKNKKKES